MGRARKRVGTAAAAAVVAVLAAVAAGCSGGGEVTSESAGAASDSGSAGSGVEGPAAEGPALSSRRLAGEQAAGKDGGAATLGHVNRPVVQTRAVIRRGEVSLVTKEMNRARNEIDDLLGRLGGYIASEDSMNDRAGRPERSVLVLRVPEPSFDDAMDRLAEIGRTKHAGRSAEDVTTQVIDVDERVATQEASLARLRSFLRKATDVADMVRVEAEIATRQAELESLKAQQKYLHDQTAMSTVTVRLRTPAAPPPPGGGSGFLAGLKDGWHALTVVLVGAATVAGALLPFALTLALLGVPAWLLFRAVRRRHAAPAPPPAAEAG